RGEGRCQCWSWTFLRLLVEVFVVPEARDGFFEMGLEDFELALTGEAGRADIMDAEAEAQAIVEVEFTTCDGGTLEKAFRAPIIGIECDHEPVGPDLDPDQLRASDEEVESGVERRIERQQRDQQAETAPEP